jgi:long-chain fatty acid transport protein
LPIIGRTFLAGTALAALALTPISARAGGFAIPEQSAIGAGMAFAGQGTSSMALSAMFWNPAAVTQTKGAQFELHVTGILPRMIVDTLPATSPALLAHGNTSIDIGRDALVGSTYAGYQYSQDIYFGLAFTSPFGLRTVATAPWPGQNLSLNASAKSIEGNPIVGYRVNDSISVGAGVRIMWAKTEFSRALVPLAATPNIASLEASDVGIGWNIGVTIKPWYGTELALGYRSQVKLSLDGDTVLPPVAPVVGVFGIDGKVTLPDHIHVGVRQRITGSLTVLGTVNWENWSVLQTVPFKFTNGPAAGGVATTFEFRYRDSWYFALGGEYQLSPQTMLRAGIGFATSPATDAVRGTAIPSDDGWRFSAGMTHKHSPTMIFDFALSYYKEKSAPINVVPGHPQSGNLLFPLPFGQLSYVGVGNTEIWFMSVALRYNFSAAGAGVQK